MHSTISVIDVRSGCVVIPLTLDRLFGLKNAKQDNFATNIWTLREDVSLTITSNALVRCPFQLFTVFYLSSSKNLLIPVDEVLSAPPK